MKSQKFNTTKIFFMRIIYNMKICQSTIKVAIYIYTVELGY